VAFALAALAACTDPRARPVPPVVQIQVAPSFKLVSPGQMVGSLYLFDTEGLQSLAMHVYTPDSAFAADSFFFLPGDNSLTRPFNWTVPPGLATGTSVTLAAKVVDFNNFATSDSLVFTIR
jgi:hypothetical protein